MFTLNSPQFPKMSAVLMRHPAQISKWPKNCLLMGFGQVLPMNKMNFDADGEFSGISGWKLPKIETFYRIGLDRHSGFDAKIRVSMKPDALQHKVWPENCVKRRPGQEACSRCGKILSAGGAVVKG